MPEWDKIPWAQGLLELNQYGNDPKLYNAAKMLEPKDRPDVPVRWMEMSHPLLKAAPLSQGTADHKTKSIFIVRRPEEDFQKDYWLAGVLGHEAEHIRRGDYDEHPAYKKQLDILSGMGRRNDPYFKNLMRMAATKKR